MTTVELRQHITAVPFRPFVMHVWDGSTIPVHDRDFILVSPLGSVVDIFQPDERHDILAGGAITRITFNPSARTTVPDTQQTSH